MDREPTAPEIGASLPSADKPPRDRRKRWLTRALLVALAIIVALAGATAVYAALASRPAIISPFQRAGAGAQASATSSAPTASPTPRIGCFQTQGADGPFTCYAADGSSVTAPTLTGLKQTLSTSASGQAILYLAQPGNPYGLAAGRYAGEYRANVLVRLPGASDSVKTGGLALAPAVALSLLKQGLARISTPSDKWLIMVPIDIHGPNGPPEVDIFFHLTQGHHYLNVNYAGVAPITNMIAPVANTFPSNHSLIEQTDGRGYSGNGINFPPYYTKVWPGREMSYFSVRWANPPLKFTWTLDNTDYGDKVTDASSPVSVTFGAFQQIGDVTPEKVLCAGGALGAGGVPVFLNAN